MFKFELAEFLHKPNFTIHEYILLSGRDKVHTNLIMNPLDAHRFKNSKGWRSKGSPATLFDID